MANNFVAVCEEWAKKSQDRLLAIAQTAIQSVIDDAQTPVAKGGRMRIDTGFLRASGQASLSGLPTGPSKPPTGAGAGTFNYDEQNVTLVLLQMAPGDSFFWGWTAEYAKYREAHDAFLDLAVQKWQSYVDAATAEAKKRFP